MTEPNSDAPLPDSAAVSSGTAAGPTVDVVVEPRRAWPIRAWRGVTGLPGRMRRNAAEIWDEHQVLILIVGFCLAFLVAIFWKSIFVVLGPGEAGVHYRLFFGGTVTEAETRTVEVDGADVEFERVARKTVHFKEGLHVIFPWDTLYPYNLRLQQVPDSFSVLSKDGLAIKIEVSIRFRPEKDLLGLLHQRIGPDYIERVVKPDVQSVCRYVFGQYVPEDIYTTQGFITQAIKQEARAQLAAHYVFLDDVLLRAVTLPPTVASAIESKLRAQQLQQEYEYRVNSEKKEAERKGIEAGGILDFQNKVMTSVPNFQQYLRFKGIEATLELAKSPNSKIVIIGGGEDRLPLILDGANRGDLPAVPLATPPRTKP